MPRALHFTAAFVVANWEILLFRRFPLQIFQFSPPTPKKGYLPSRSSGGKLEGGVRGAQYLINK